MVFGLLFLISTYVLWRCKTEGLKRTDLLLAWILKIGASLLFLLIYTEYYGSGTLTADPASFMLESQLLANVAHESIPDYLRFLSGLETQSMIDHYLSTTTHWNSGDLTLINDSKNVIRVNSLIYFLSNGSIYIHLLVFSFLSLLGFRELFLTFSNSVSVSKRFFWFALILVPSLIFWTGSMLKEPLMMVGLCLVLRAWLGGLAGWKMWWRWIVGLLLLIAFKPYVLICLLPALLFYWLTISVFRERMWLSFSTLFIIVFAGILFFPKQTDKGVFYLTRKQFDFINIGKGGIHAYADTCFYYFRPDQFQYLNINELNNSVYLTRPLSAKKVTLGKALPFKDVNLQPNTESWFLYFRSNGCSSYVPVTTINSSLSQLIRNIPEAFVNATFRPFFGDPGGTLKYFAVVETILLFGWFFYSLRFWKRLPKQHKITFATLLLFASCLLILVGWITPVLGAIVRYRIPAYLVIVIVGMMLFRYTKSENKWEK